MATILDLVVKHNALTLEEILRFQQSTRQTFIEHLLMNVYKYPKLYNALEEYYQNNPKEINNIGTDGETPLLLAVASKAMVKFLLSCGTNINHQSKNGHTALHYAAISYYLDSGKLLCKYGANVHIKDCDNTTPIDNAILFSYDGYDKFVRLLLEYDSNTTEEEYKKLVNNISLLNTLS